MVQSLPDDRLELAGAVQHRAVLHAGALPHHDPALVAAENRLRPDGRTRADHDVSDDRAVGMDEGVGVDVGLDVTKGVEGHAL